MIVPAKIESKLQYNHNDGAIEFYPHRGRTAMVIWSSGHSKFTTAHVQWKLARSDPL